ncbi:MAG: AAA family ATPase [Candidatus Liptonbacteria bacterium]|nr:AAA family ATPase [Candidatus Liptonbacteria bacterium]
MPGESLHFQDDEQKREEELRLELMRAGGILYRVEKDAATGEDRPLVNIFGVEVPTYASKEDVETIRGEMILSETDQGLLRAIVESYKLRQPLLFEGDPGSGKTFLMKKFAALINGKDAPILELVGTPRTSELEILGHWAPKGLRERDAGKYGEAFLEVTEGEEHRKLKNKFDGELALLNRKFQDGKLNLEQFQEKFGELSSDYIDSLKSAFVSSGKMKTILGKEAEWEFKEGALLRAYSGNHGRGYILIVDEFNLIPSNYQQIFLQIGGDRGGLSDSISFWGNSGKTRYERGEDTWIGFASNFPEKTPGRSEVVAPMADRLTWKTLTPEEVSKKKSAIRRTAGGRLTKRTKELEGFESGVPGHEAGKIAIPLRRGIEWDAVLDEELGSQIADIVDLMDAEFVKNYEQVGDSVVIKGERRRRTQQMEFSGRNALRLFSYLDTFQTRDKATGRVDFAATIGAAADRYYLDRLADPEMREKMANVFKEILSGVTGQILFEGRTITRKEVLDILVERASGTEAEKKKQDKTRRAEEEQKYKEARYRAEDALERLLRNPKAPNSIKKIKL